jgi:hypothetical protein
MKISFRRAGLALLISLSPAGFAQAQTITVSPALPGDITGGAPAATLQQAAEFAWQEFFALNWPALAGQRDAPDTNQKFGAGDGLLVWESFRSKVEIFNLTSKSIPPGYTPTGPSFGYNTTTPSYVYKTAEIPACPGQVAPATPSWVNLDETTQIGLDQMFAGGGPVAGTNNSAPQLIRFAVKANHVQYAYVAQNKFFLPGNKTIPAGNNIKAFTARPPVAPTAPFISFPASTIEVKSAWRPLNANDNPAHFRMQTVRFYENKGKNNTPCYFEEQWGLIALHIIQKTPTAPAFIYATFEQAENIKQPDGTAVEDVNGMVVNAIPGAGPTTPAMSYMDSPTAPKVKTTGPFCTPAKNLYFKDNATDTGLTGGGAICVNQRYQPIPPEVIAVNKAAHDAMAAYNTANQVQNSPWPFYKLVSVQAQPFDVSAISQTDPVHGPAVFFQANIVVETDYTLQQFLGRIAAPPVAGAPTSVPLARNPPPNVVTPVVGQGGGVVGVNMGGCMGCHGNAQIAGFDFSFILREGFTPAPETPSALQVATTNAALKNRYRNIFPR